MVKQKSGLPWGAMFLAAIPTAWVMQLLEDHAHMSRGPAFLILFPAWFVLTAVFAAIGGKH